MSETNRLSRLRGYSLSLVFFSAIWLMANTAYADAEGHGPDSWQVTGVSKSSVLNARMGPGKQYPVIDTFAPDEHGLKQVTCVPYHTYAQYQALTEAQVEKLPPRWCLMRSTDAKHSGWVLQRYIAEDSAPQASGEN